MDDRMEDGIPEETAVCEIGTVDELVSQIIADIPLGKLVKEKITPKKKLKAWEIVLLVLGSPIWLSLLIAALAVILSLYVVLWSVIIVPQAFADEFIANDGKDSYRLNASIIDIEDVIDADPARVWWDSWGYADASLTAMSKAEKMASDKVGISANGLYGQSLYLHLKFMPHHTDLVGRGNNCIVKNFTIMRYAEVLLMYAEALIQQGKNAEALTYINQIQNRAGSKTVSTSADMTVLEKEKKYKTYWTQLAIIL